MCICLFIYVCIYLFKDIIIMSLSQPALFFCFSRLHLVQPDILTPGYAVVKTLVPLRRVACDGWKWVYARELLWENDDKIRA